MVKNMTNHLFTFFLLTACLFRNIEVVSRAHRTKCRSKRPSLQKKSEPKPAVRKYEIPKTVNWRPPPEFARIKTIDLDFIKRSEVCDACAPIFRTLRRLRLPVAMAPVSA